jgi:branched-chain amino acid transport system substrate-binding protein
MRKTFAVALLLPVALLAACSSSSSSSDSSSAAASQAPAASGGAASGGAASGEELVIGYAGGFTGDCAVGDLPALDGINYAVGVINSSGGMSGHPVTIISKDMKGDSATGGTVAQELIDQGAAVLLAPCFPGMSAGVIQAGGKAGIPVISPVTTQPEYVVVGGSPAYLAAFGDNVQASAAAEYALKNGAKTVFTVSSPDLTYTQNTPKFFVDAFAKGGGKSVGDVSFSLGQTDFSAQVTQIANLPEQPDLIYTAMFPPDTSNFVRALRAAGVKTRIMGADGWDSASLLDAGADALEGSWFTTHGAGTPGSAFSDFIDGMAKANGKPSDGPAFAALGDTTLQIIAAAVEKAGSIDPAAIAAALPELENVETVTGNITYKGTNGVPKKDVTIGVVEGGKFSYPETFTPSYIAQP